MSKARDLANFISAGGTLADLTATAAELNALDGITSTVSELNILDGVTSTAAELNILDGVTSTAAELNTLDGVTSTVAELNLLDGVTATTTELNYVDGVTSNIQTQIDAKAALVSPTFTGTINAAALVLSGNLTVSGTTTSVNSNTVNIGDAVITLNADETGTPSQDGGIEVERGNSHNVRFIWDESEDQWSSEIYNGSAFVAANIKAATATVTDLDTTSDKNLKENIRSIENPVEAVKQINGVQFNWIETGKNSAGVIAQEVEAVLPELVTTKNEGYKTVNYMGIIGLLVETVKELENRIQQLEDS